MRRTITLDVDPNAFFDEVRNFGLMSSTCPIGSRVIAALLGGLSWREGVGLGVYGINSHELPPEPADGTGRDPSPPMIDGDSTRDDLNPVAPIRTEEGLKEDGDLCHIQTDRGLWRPKSEGYTDRRELAGVWTRSDAERIIEDLGPEKEARLIPARDGEAVTQ